MNPSSSTPIDLNLHRSIPLESKDGHYAVTISPDGRLIAGGCRAVEVFDVDTGIRLWKFDTDLGMGDEMHAASFSPDAKRLVAGGERGVLFVSIVTSQSPDIFIFESIIMR
jgi:WD40 repeat protein